MEGNVLTAAIILSVSAFPAGQLILDCLCDPDNDDHYRKPAAYASNWQASEEIIISFGFALSVFRDHFFLDLGSLTLVTGTGTE